MLINATAGILGIVAAMIHRMIYGATDANGVLASSGSSRLCLDVPSSGNKLAVPSAGSQSRPAAGSRRSRKKRQYDARRAKRNDNSGTSPTVGKFHQLRTAVAEKVSTVICDRICCCRKVPPDSFEEHFGVVLCLVEIH